MALVKSKGIVITALIIVAFLCLVASTTAAGEYWTASTSPGSDVTGMPITGVASTEACFDTLKGSQFNAAVYDSAKRHCWIKQGSLAELRAMRTDGSAGFVTILKSPTIPGASASPPSRSEEEPGTCKFSKEVGSVSDEDLVILTYVQENLLKFRSTIMAHEKYGKDPRARCLSAWNGRVLPSNRSTGATMQPKAGCMVMNVPYIRRRTGKQAPDSEVSDRALTIGLHELAHIYPWWSKTGGGHDAVFYDTHRFYSEFATNPANGLNFRLAVNCRLCTFLVDCAGVCPNCQWEEPSSGCASKKKKKK